MTAKIELDLSGGSIATLGPRNYVRYQPLTDRIALGFESFKHSVSEGREGIGQRAASGNIGFGVSFAAS